MSSDATTTLIYGIELNRNDIKKIGKYFNISNLSDMSYIFNVGNIEPEARREITPLHDTSSKNPIRANRYDKIDTMMKGFQDEITKLFEMKSKEQEAIEENIFQVMQTAEPQAFARPFDNKHLELFKDIAYGVDKRFYITTLIDGVDAAGEDPLFSEDGFALGIFVADSFTDSIAKFSKPANYKKAVAMFDKYLAPFLAKLKIKVVAQFLKC